MPDLTKVRTTFEPDREVEVGPAELLDLQRQGLLVADAPAPKAKPATTEKGDA